MKRINEGMKWKKCETCGLRIYPRREHICDKELDEIRHEQNDNYGRDLI